MRVSNLDKPVRRPDAPNLLAARPALRGDAGGGRDADGGALGIPELLDVLGDVRLGLRETV